MFFPRCRVFTVLFLMLGLVTGTVMVHGEEPDPDDPRPLELTEQTVHRYRNHIRPSEKERRYLKIGWRPTFWQAVEEAQEKKKPILLWAMNGHPLGHT